MLKTTSLPKKPKADKPKKQGVSTDPLFQYIKAVSQTKEYLLNTSLSEKDYLPFMVNRGLSYFPDTIMLVNQMNINCHLSKKMQQDYYYVAVRPRARYSKWFKADQASYTDFSVIKEYYKYNDQKTSDALRILSDDQINDIRKKLEKGGQYG
jgi:hypothetical protein